MKIKKMQFHSPLMILMLSAGSASATMSGLQATATTLKLFNASTEVYQRAKTVSWRELPKNTKKFVANNPLKSLFFGCLAIGAYYGIKGLIARVQEAGSLAEKVREYYTNPHSRWSPKSAAEIIKSLQKSEDLTRRDRYGKTARDYATEYHDNDLLKAIDAAEKGERESLAAVIREKYEANYQLQFKKYKTEFDAGNNPSDAMLLKSIDPAFLQDACCKNKDLNMPDMFGKRAFDYALDVCRDRELLKALLSRVDLEISPIQLQQAGLFMHEDFRNCTYLFALWLQDNAHHFLYEYLGMYGKKTIEDFKKY